MNVAAAFATADAVATINDGERAQGLARLGDAANQAWPAAPLYRVRLSAFWTTTALRQDDEDLRGELLVRAYSEAEEALRWNPFDHRALPQAAFTARELARISPEQVPDAIAAHLRWAERMPDFGQPLVELGRTYLIFDEPARTLEALEAAIAVTTDQSTLDLAHELQALGARRTRIPLTDG